MLWHVFKWARNFWTSFNWGKPLLPLFYYFINSFSFHIGEIMTITCVCYSPRIYDSDVLASKCFVATKAMTSVAMIWHHLTSINSSSGITLCPDYNKCLEAAVASIETFRRLGNLGNFRFCASFNCSPGQPSNDCPSLMRRSHRSW